MYSVRRELELLGPERVRLAMQAFENPDGQPCFLMCAGGATDREGSPRFYNWEDGLEKGRKAVGADQLVGISAVEAMFEEWRHAGGYPESRRDLRQECISFLAEHGTAAEKEVDCAESAT